LSNSSILIFESKDDFFSELITVVEMTTDELIAYENSKGYKSVGRQADEFYQSIDFESFKSKEDILNFVNRNNKYLQIVEEAGGELAVEPILYSQKERFFVNEHNLFQIQDSIYKVLENAIVSTSQINSHI
jgi:hypothetical protein